MKIFFVCLIAIFLSSPALSDVPAKAKEDARYYREQGYVLQAQGDLKGALAYYREAVKFDPSCHQAYNDLGVVYEDYGDRETAIKMYTKAIELNPDYLPPYTNLALLYERSNDTIDAVYYWQQRYLLDDEASIWKQKALEHILELELSEGVKREILKGNAMSLPELKKLEEARLHIDMGKEMASEGDYDKATVEFKKSLSLAPPDKSLQLEAGQQYAVTKKIRDKERIRSYLEEALSAIDSDNHALAAAKLKSALSVIFSILE